MLLLYWWSVEPVSFLGTKLTGKQAFEAHLALGHMGYEYLHMQAVGAPIICSLLIVRA